MPKIKIVMTSNFVKQDISNMILLNNLTRSSNMAIRTSEFGGWHLSGDDAKAFRKQIEEAGPNPLGQEAIRRGLPLVKEYIEKGYATIRPKRTSAILKD